MRIFRACLLAGLLPAQALAGAEYTAEDVIRYFEQANAATAPAVARAAPAASRGIVIGDPAAPASKALGPVPTALAAPVDTAGGAAVSPAPGGTPPAAPGVAVGTTAPSPGVVIGAAPAAQGAAAASPAETPLAIPMTGAKAGFTVPPAEPAIEPSTETATVASAAPAAAAPAAPVSAYDLMVTFEVDSATLTPQARQNLDAFAQALLAPALAALRFAVEGHTDASGSTEHNLELSKARAASVVAYLVEHGVEPARLTAAGYGETRPRLADAEHPDNRRVETRRIE